MGVCYTALSNGCTALTCDANKFNHDGDVSNGCESDLPLCVFVLSDDASLSGTDGYNVLTESCYMTSTFPSISSGQTLKIKRDDSVVNEIVIDRGGAIPALSGRLFNVYGGALEVEGVTLTGGFERYNGGAVQVSGSSSSAMFTHCKLSGNICQDGGAVYVTGSGASAAFTSCLLSDNIADETGGAVLVSGGGASAAFTSCTLSGNTAYRVSFFSYVFLWFLLFFLSL